MVIRCLILYHRHCLSYNYSQCYNYSLSYIYNYSPSHSLDISLAIRNCFADNYSYNYFLLVLTKPLA